MKNNHYHRKADTTSPQQIYAADACCEQSQPPNEQKNGFNGSNLTSDGDTYVSYVVIPDTYLPQNNFAPSPVVSSKPRVALVWSLLICLSKQQFVSVCLEPRPCNVMLQIRYTP